MGLRHYFTTRRLAACGAALAALLLIALAPQLLGGQVSKALDGVRDASTGWLWLAGTCFAVAVTTAAFAWRAAFRLCGGRLTRADACARYGIGSLVNTLTPARIGDVARIALFARALPGRDRLLTSGGACAAIGAARVLALGVLLVAASVVGALPLWPLWIVAGVVGSAALLSLVARDWRPAGRFAHLLDAFRELGRRPAASAPLLGWIGLATAARIAGAAASAAALGVEKPLYAALLIVPALDLAGLFPLTPGNVGLTSGAIAIALQGVGLNLTTALAVGIALHAVETLAGVGFGVAGLVWLASGALDGVRLWALRVACGVAALGVAAAFGATVLV
jgi:glycosyltransferase 2 family protein